VLECRCIGLFAVCPAKAINDVADQQGVLTMYLPSEFNRDMAGECAGLVMQAYRQYTDFIEGLSWQIQGDYQLLGDFGVKPAGFLGGLMHDLEPFGFVAKNRSSGKVFVVFRGTESVEDWLSDLTFTQVDHPWGCVEKGFYALYRQCAGPIHAAVAGPNDGLIVTGHSLGGALAVLACADLAETGAPSLYSFAGPRVGDIAFAGKFNAKLPLRAWRVVNSEDLVATLPLASPILYDDQSAMKLGSIIMGARQMNYQHVGESVNFTVNKGSISDNHKMETYIEALQR
jgi:triacylglycerol lipase